MSGQDGEAVPLLLEGFGPPEPDEFETILQGLGTEPEAAAVSSAPVKEVRSALPRGRIAFALLVGGPSLLVLLLEYLAYAGVYVDFFRPFWRPVPEGTVWLLGGLGLIAALWATLVEHRS